ncbi:predicted protein [Uncinocarpus reesii 1704]|uniref:Autophagy-related protein n=1 Tax=Uncinocarpus reesii (strain UAMH 1704) TaxID=336963 RepID=C4JUV7_UNCRE|nr:uncharacterized protein UREG_04910 [Uncinocarpus reesii 1704]EEP80068.1 predicted protein [Uncinocarpus reesii 1704]
MSSASNASDIHDSDLDNTKKGAGASAQEIPRDGGSEGETSAADSSAASLGSRKALWAFLILCYSTGPTASMVFNYVSAAIQSAANLVGHQPGSDKPCGRRGSNIKCVVKFGAGEIDYLSYLLYLRAIGRAMEGVITILVSGLADYSSYRKTMMMVSIILFGALALPFAGLTESNYSHLTALSVLYCTLTTIQGVYVVIEASYIPIFMRSVGWFRPRQPALPADAAADSSGLEKRTWTKGFTVSVLALVAGNLGGLTALIIGVILVYSRGSYVKIGYHNYLLAITIGGCITILFATIGQFLLPAIEGKKRPKGADVFLLPARGWLLMVSSVRRYPEAFKLCIGWVLWHTSYSNYLGLIQSLFLQVTGISNGSGVYQVWSFTNVIFACMGSLGFLFIFPRIQAPIKSWAYVFLAVNFLCIFWGCIGISNNVPIGYKHTAEFWVEQVLFMSTSSALRSYNRAVYSSLIPKGSEAQFFGLEITLDLATGWINPLVQGVIQNRTNNLRFPMLANVLLISVAILLYIWVDIPKGIEDAKVPLGETPTDTVPE